MTAIVDDLTLAERRAVALIGLAIRLHGGRAGDGMFTGVTRYAVLEQRLRLAAERSRTVRQCWDTLCKSLQWSLAAIRWDEPALALIAPAVDDHDVLRALADRSQSCVMIARYLLRHPHSDPKAPEESRAEWPTLADPLDVFDLAPQNPAASGGIEPDDEDAPERDTITPAAVEPGLDDSIHDLFGGHD